MNPISSAINEIISQGRELIGVVPDDKINPKKVIFHFEDATTSEIVVAADRQAFMKYWKQASAYIRRMQAIKGLENLN